MKIEWSDRLQEWLRDAKWSVPELARRLNADQKKPVISEAALRKYVKGAVDQPRGNIIARIAAVFGRSELELKYGISPNEITRESKRPLFTARELAALSHIDDRKVWEGRSVSVLSNDVGPEWFGVIVPDDACAPRITAGSIAYCDPTADVRPGDSVIAKINGLPSVVCRRYREIDPLNRKRFALISENADYGTFESTDENPIAIWKIVKVLSDP